MNQTFNFTLFILIMLILCLPAAAPRATAEQLTARQVLDNYVAALGGRAAIRRLSNRSAKGSVEMPNMRGAGTVEFYAKAPNKMLNIMQLPDIGLLKQGFNGVAAWELGFNGVRRLSGGELAAIKRDASFYRDINLQGEYSRLNLKGREQIGERTAHLIEGVRADGSRDRLYFDTQTGLLMRYSTQRETQAGTQPADLYLWDYREVDGVKVPFWEMQSTTLPTGGGIVFTIKWQQVKHNVPMNDAIFDAPAAP